MLFRHLPKIFRISTPVLRWLSSIIFLMTYGCAGAYAIYIYIYMLSSVSYEYIYIYNEYIYIYQCCYARLDATIWKASLRTALPNTCVDKKQCCFLKIETDVFIICIYVYICVYNKKHRTKLDFEDRKQTIETRHVYVYIYIYLDAPTS